MFTKIQGSAAEAGAICEMPESILFTHCAKYRSLIIKQEQVSTNGDLTAQQCLATHRNLKGDIFVSRNYNYHNYYNYNKVQLEDNKVMLQDFFLGKWV